MYPCLWYRRLGSVHIDYVKEFLHENNTRLPAPTCLYINYEQLAVVIENFTNDKELYSCKEYPYR
jgi:hypothetical protein